MATTPRIVSFHFLVLCAVSSVIGIQHLDINTLDFGNWLDTTIGYPQLKAHLDKNKWTAKTTTSSHLLFKEFGPKLYNRLKIYYDKVRNITRAVERDYELHKDNTESTRPYCCDMAVLDYSTACDISVALRGSAWWPTSDVSDVMRRGFRKGVDTVFYVGTSTGSFSRYPNKNIEACREYDNRLRPWYIDAISTQTKCVILLLEISSDTYNKMAIIKKAANMVVDMLSRDDKVTVVAFRRRVYTPRSSDGCFSEQLASATQENKAKIQYFVGNMQAEGTANVTRGLEEAFTLFRKQEKRTPGSCKAKIVLMVVDSENKTKIMDRSLVDYVQNSNESAGLNLFTYAIGEEIHQECKDILTKISSPDGFQHVTNLTTFPVELALYFEKIGAHGNFGINIATVTRPYIDFFDKLPILSICSTAYDYGSLMAIGVACTDVPMVKLTEVTEFPGSYPDHYSILMKSEGSLILHPLIQYNIHSPELDFRVKLDQLECTPNNVATGKLFEVLSQTYSLKSCTRRTVPLGDIEDGMRSEDMKSTFHCRKLNFLDWHLYLCIVEASDTPLSIDYNLIESYESYPENLEMYFSYDNLLYTRKQGERCCMSGNWLASNEFISFTYTYRAFKDQFAFLSRNHSERRIETREVENQILYGTGNRPLKNGVKQTTKSLLGILPDIWINVPERSENILFRYLCTKNGILATFPGSQLPRPYDCTKRPWYRRAIGSRDNAVVTPFMWEGKSLLSVARRLCAKNKHPNSKCKVFGALVFDLTPEYLTEMLRETIPECSRNDLECLLMDDHGFMIVYNQSETFCTSKYQKTHITSAEPAIAKKLIADGKLVQKQCYKIFTSKVFQWWEEKFNSQPYGNSYFQITPVAHTNLYLIIKNISASKAELGCLCLATELNTNTAQECLRQPKQCECPCYREQTNYNHCAGKYDEKTPYDMICPNPGDYFLLENDSNAYKDRLKKECNRKNFCRGGTDCSQTKGSS